MRAQMGVQLLLSPGGIVVGLDILEIGYERLVLVNLLKHGRTGCLDGFSWRV